MLQASPCMDCLFWYRCRGGKLDCLFRAPLAQTEWRQGVSPTYFLFLLLPGRLDKYG